MKSKILLAAAIMVLAAQGAALSAIYKWVDENGVITFRDTPPQENPEKAQRVEVAPVQSASMPVPKGSHRAAEKPVPAGHKVELYVTSWCPYCRKAEQFFRSRGIPFNAYDIEKDAGAARRKEQLDGRRGVPFAIVDGQKIHGFSEAAYSQALNAKR